MKRALAVIVGVALVCLVAYVSWLNPETVEYRFAPDRTLHLPVGALTVFAFLVGAVLVLLVVTVEAGRRAIVTWRAERRRRKSFRIDQWEEHGEELVWAGDAQHGRALLQKAWQRRPEQAHAVIALAESYRDTGELHRARGLLFDAANQHHTNPDVLYALADMHRLAGEAGPRIEVLERLRALHPRAPRVLRALRDAYQETGRWQDAAATQEALLGELRDLQQATRERERLTVLRYQASLGLSDPAERVAALEALADGRGNTVPVLISLGDALRAAGRADEAAVLWERTLRNQPRTVLFDRLAAMATETRHRDRLRTVLRKLRADAVNADSVRLQNAQLHLADGNLDAAARELEAVQDAAAPQLLHRLWAEIHQRRGQVEQAFAAFARADGHAQRYRCKTCQRCVPEWTGYCPQCGAWDSYRATVEISAA